jgi:glycoside/pentoside/hexuronide:cation symporter, GPH family
MTKPAERVPTRIALAYGTGQLGAQIFRDTPAVLLPLFMTTMLGVPAWISGFVVLIPKLWLIVCDPLVGAWSDRVKPRLGRTPFLVAGAVFTSLAFFALFSFTAYPSPTVAAIALCALFFLGSTAFSAFSVPYLAVASELSPDPHQRTRIMTFRMVFTTIGVLIGVGVAQPLIAAFGDGAAGWRGMGAVLGLICLVTMLATALSLAKVRLIPGEPSSGGLLAQLAPVRGNRPFQVLLATCFIQSVGQASGYTVIGFIYFYVVQAVWIILPFVLLMSVAGIAAQPMWLALSRRYGKPRCYVAASLAWTLVTTTWWFVGPADDVVLEVAGVGALGTQHLLVLLRGLVIGVVNSGFIMLSLSMLTDTIDYERRRGGTANEGIFSGIFTAAEKLAFALGPLIAGVVLSAYGFVSSTGGAVAQSPEALTGIVLLYSLIPVTTQLLSLAVFSRYRLPAN